ncbi:DUF998 domain-containing protein [Georgenia sp. Z1491]|uniref:DUF998 domain-containing protein n=1 Tax=Georgenia sp. Z1491 TaxID=3416707 RepID=UPI003CF45A45
MRKHWWPIAGIVWIVSGLAAVGAELWSGVRSSAPYSFAEQAISDLGWVGCGASDAYPDGPVEICSPEHTVLNVAWIVTGLAFAAAALALRRVLPVGKRGGIGAWLLVAGGLGQAGAGLWPSDVDLTLHTIIAMIGFLAQSVALILIGSGWLRSRAALGRTTLIAGIVTIFGLLLLMAPTAWSLPFGILERAAAWPFLLWLVLAGAAAMRASRAPDARGARGGSPAPRAAGR